MADPTKASAPILSQGRDQRKDAFAELRMTARLEEVGRNGREQGP